MILEDKNVILRPEEVDWAVKHAYKRMFDNEAGEVEHSILVCINGETMMLPYWSSEAARDRFWDRLTVAMHKDHNEAKAYMNAVN